MKKIFATSGTCAKQIEFDYEDGRIYNLKFEAGCNGNLKAIALLVEGKKLEEIKVLFEGLTCGKRVTSCTDQLTKAISEVL